MRRLTEFLCLLVTRSQQALQVDASFSDGEGFTETKAKCMPLRRGAGLLRRLPSQRLLGLGAVQGQCANSEQWHKDQLL